MTCPDRDRIRACNQLSRHAPDGCGLPEHHHFVLCVCGLSVSGTCLAVDNGLGHICCETGIVVVFAVPGRGYSTIREDTAMRQARPLR